MKNKLPLSFIVFVTALLFTCFGTVSQAAPILVSPSPASFGEIERITLDNPADVYSAGVMVVGGIEMIIPRNLLIDLPANRLSLQQIFDQAPAACKTNGESGLAKADKCNGSGSGGIATLSAVRTNAGNVIIGDLFIQKAAESVNGRVTYINYDQGYYRVNGIDNDPDTGAMVRLNDPTSRHTIQSGAGCTTSGPGYPNCSPDPRFTLDPDNYTNTFATGYPVCIPSTVARSFTNPLGGPSSSQASANGSGDYLCPVTNRTPGVINEPAVADSRRFAPVILGDTVLAEGNFETINGVRFLSAHTTTVHKALATSTAAGQPDYLFLAEVGTEAPAFQNQRLVNLFIGFTTLAPTDVDIWSVHRDPVNNEIHEFPYASVTGCDAGSGNPGECSSQGLINAGANIFKINYKVDFNKGPDPKLSPCAHLRASRFATNPLYAGLCSGGVTTASDFAVLSPSPHEIIARTGRKITSPAGSLITIDINGNEATNGEYLFPLGLNLGGLGVAEMSEIDLNALDTPVIFEGIPWNLDRRLSPSGCLNGGCESLASSPLGTFALDPFPYSGLDPRSQAPGLPTGSYSDPVFNTSGNPLANIRNRMFSYVNSTGKFNGNATLLPYTLGTFPADPPLRTINPTPALNVFPPIAVEDEAVVNSGPGASVVINVLGNDIPILGNLNPASLLIATNPGNGTVQINGNSTITYFPSNPFTVGTVTFSYTVANDFGYISLPGTVTVNILRPPLANNDTAASLTMNSSTVINVTGNDTAAAPATINPATVAMVSFPANGTVAAHANGTVTYTPNAGYIGNDSFSYTVKDSSGQQSNTASVTVIVSAPPAASGVTLTDLPPSPQLPGAQILFTAAGSGGSGSYEYEFWLFNGSTWSKVRSYSTVPTWSWNTTGLPAGAYSVAANVRALGSTAAVEAVAYVPYQITTPATTLLLTPNIASPQLPGTTVTFGAAASGGSGTYEYRFWVFDGTTWTLGQDYSPLPTFIWNTTGLTAGNYQLAADVRNVASPAYREAVFYLNYTLTTPVTSVNVISDQPTPHPAGTPVIFAASGVGGSGTYEYEFSLFNGINWTLVKSYSGTGIWTLPGSTAAGNYVIGVNARNAGATNVSDTVSFVPYVVQ